MRIDEEHFSGTIDDFMLAAIRSSGLVVADLTGNKANVYFEAGFAMGLGIPVIRTCRDYSAATEDKDKVAFDQNHYPILFWDSTERLRRLVTDRVNALGPLTSRPTKRESS